MLWQISKWILRRYPLTLAEVLWRPIMYVFIYLSINNYLVPFKVASLRYNTLMPAFFPILETLLKRTFWHHQYLFNRGKSVSSILERVKSQRGPSPLNTVVETLTQMHWCVSWCKIQMIGFSTILYAIRQNCFAQSANNFKVVLLIDRTILWQEFVMHHTPLQSKKIVSRTFTFDWTW